MNRTLNLIAAGLLTLTFSAAATAQSNDAKQAEPNPVQRFTSEPRPDTSQSVVKTYYLKNVSEQSDANEILIALRNMLDHPRIILVTSEKAIVLDASSEQQALAQRVITELDRPKKSYRLTFTLADSDSGKRVGVQHFSIIVTAGQRTTLKQGSKIPVLTGSTKNPGDTQFQYLDIGMSFDISLNDSPGGLLLKAKVEDSAVGTQSEYGNGSGPIAQEPIIHQTTLEGTSIVALGKPLTLGSIDVAGSTRHVDIEVVAEPIS
jgi:hypothetical protein